MDKTYTIIPDFMLDFNLNLTETIALAVIYGFCQDGKSDFHGSYSYLARKCKVQRRQAIRVVSKLIDKGYVKKSVQTINGVQFCSFKTIIEGSVKMTPPVTLEHLGSDIITSGGSVKMTPNNINKENKEIIKRGGTFVPPTLDEVRQFFILQSFSSDPVDFWTYYANTDWKISGGRQRMKDWHLAAFRWERNESKFNRNGRK